MVAPNSKLAPLLLTTVAIALAVAGTADSARLLGSRKCTWGPSYWCQSLRESAECGATKHCISRVWESKHFPEDRDEICDVCKEMVKEARDQLESNETQTEIKEVLEGSCDILIPIKAIAKECKRVVDDFIPELIDTLASEMEPNAVCSVAGLCNSEKIDKMLRDHYQSSSPPSESECPVCVSAMQKAAVNFRALASGAFADSLLSFCNRNGGSFSDACKIAILENSGSIQDWLSDLNRSLCVSSGACSDSELDSMPQIQMLSNPSDLECEFCEKLVSGFKDELGSNLTMEEIQKVMQNMCKTLGQPDRIKKCIRLVNDYYLPMIRFLDESIDPQAICGFAGLCQTRSQLIEDAITDPISFLVPYDLDPPAEEEDPPTVQEASLGVQNGQLIGGYFMPQTVLLINTPSCLICDFVMHKMKEWLNDGHSPSEVDKGLREICDRSPRGIKDQCNNFVEKYGPIVGGFISQGMPLQDICIAIKLCPSEVDPETSPLTSIEIENNPIMEMKKKSEECTACQYIVHIVLDAVTDRTNEEEIKNVLEYTCRIFPASTQRRCEDIIEKYSETLVDLIAKNLTPDEICELMSLCQSHKIIKDEGCVLCEFVITTLDKLLDDKKDVEKIQKALEQVCSYLPKTISKECTQFVDTYTTIIIDMISHDLSPDQVCTELGLCNSKVSMPVLMEPEEVMIQDDGEDDIDYYCTLCEYFLSEVEKKLAPRDVTEDQIRNLLEQVCYLVSENVRDDCKTVVDWNVDMIVKLMREGDSPDKICAEIAVKMGQNCNKMSQSLPPRLLPEDPLLTNDVSSFGSSDNDIEWEEVAGGSCVTCEFVMSSMSSVQADIWQAETRMNGAGALCSYLPDMIKQNCDEFVSSHGEAINLVLRGNIRPDQFCQSYGICQRTVTWDATSVKGGKCIWGPALWCASPFHMSACDTKEYCESIGTNRFLPDY